LTLLDTALHSDRAVVAPMLLDSAALRAQARVGALQPFLSEVIGATVNRRPGGALAQQLAGAPEGDRAEIVLALVRSAVADVLGYESSAAVDVGRAFKEAGFDSLAA
ncbi:hypothetical protein BST28_23005, partial [Mycolicibacter kumamotonensis]